MHLPPPCGAMVGLNAMMRSVEKIGIPASGERTVAILRACLSPASFWSPEQVGPQIAWLEHAPFAFWLVEALRPNLIVELGTHGGFSYFSLCQAVQSSHLDSRCYAVDTWKGDEHAGFYGEEVFRQVEDHNRQHYLAFSTLIRSTFDEALPHFSDGSIDLLHIDGRHTFIDVKHDFSTWQLKLSERAVVLFHGTNVRQRNFGVSKLWENLCHSFPHFEFLHGNGLGVLGVGQHLPDQVRTLFSLTDNAEAATNIRNGYARLGSAVTLQFMANQLNPIIDQQKKELVQWSVNAAALREDIASRTAEGTRLAEQIATQSNELVRLRENITLRIAEETRLREQTATQSNELARLRDALDRRTAQISQLEQQLQQTHSNLDRMLAEHTRQLEAFQQALAERSKELGALQQALVERDARVTGLDHELAERGKELGALQKALSERDARVSALNRRLSERGKELGALQQALIGRDARVSALNRRLSEL